MQTGSWASLYRAVDSKTHTQLSLKTLPSGNIGKEEMGLVKKKREPTLCPADTSVLLMLPMDTVIITGIM